MQVCNISAHDGAGKGWAGVEFTGRSPDWLINRVSIKRPGYATSFLGKSGWQASEYKHFFALHDRPGTTSFGLLIPPEVVEHLEFASNYQFSFFDASEVMLDSVPISWRGLVFRPRRVSDSPFGATSRYSTIENEPLNSERKHGLNFINEPQISQPWGPRPFPDFGSGATEPAPAKDFYTLGDGIDGVTEQKRVPENIFSATEVGDNVSPKMRACSNRACGVEIFESMDICPFCNTRQ